MGMSLLLIIAGTWLVLQTIVGDLPGRLLSWRDANTLPGPTTDGGGASGGGGGGGGSW